MAKIKKGILGPISGSLGNIVGCIRYGIPYLRTKPLNYNDAKNPKQVAQRNRNKACVALYHIFRFTIFRPIWKLKAKNTSAYSLFLKVNSMMFNGDMEIADYDNLKISIGDLLLPDVISAGEYNITDKTITISWIDYPGDEIAAPSDQLRIVAICRDEKVELQNLSVTRQEKKATFKLPFSPVEEVHLYIFFQNKDCSGFSESFHLPVKIPSASIQ